MKILSHKNSFTLPIREIEMKDILITLSKQSIF